MPIFAVSKRLLIMNTKEIIYIDLSSGSFFLKDWQYYFAELVATANHDWVDSDDCPVSIVDGILTSTMPMTAKSKRQHAPSTKSC